MKLISSTIILISIPMYTIVGYAQKCKVVKIDPRSKGRIFLGIGAVSAGASSRLLLDYPMQQRSQILNLLFRPKFGASLQILKVEIGGDINSTDGTEPSYAHTRQEFLYPKFEYFQQDYECWLMKEARNRNHNIKLGCLEWGTPGWIGQGRFYSQDNINYVTSFIKNVKKYYNISIDYTGIWNERMYNINYIKELRKSLDNKGLKNVKIVAADQCCGNQWSIAKDIQQDKELSKSIAIFGDHYPERSSYPNRYQSNILLKKTNKPIENSEGGPWKGSWEGFRYLVKMYNRDYIIGKMTRQLTWSLISSYYNNLSLPGSGLMTANTPWSGYFDVQPAIWAAAHTTQFTSIGWRYLNEGCGFLGDSTGSYVTLISPDQPHNYSIIIETMDASKKQKITFKLYGNLSKNDLAVWRSIYKQEAFIRQEDIIPHKGKFSIELLPKAVYSITSTTGQQKGCYSSPIPEAFPLPYQTGFEKDHLGQLPKYFSDQCGVFEVKRRSDGKGNCLQQIIREKGIAWNPNGSFVETIIGDTSWTNYEISVDVNINENTGSAKIIGRLIDTYRGIKPPAGYWFEIYTGGRWILCAGDKILKSGNHIFAPFLWHKLKMKLLGDTISITLDGQALVTIENHKYSHGMAGLGSGYNIVQFDNFSVKEVDANINLDRKQ